ncbi:hypothetical protein YC2023_060218 [Brassica napus]
MPSFSLGLSQEDAPVAATEKITPLSYVSPAKEPIEEAPELRKSKSSRIMPDGLQDYKCDLKVTENLPLIPDLEVRFKLMEETVLNGPVVILRNGYGVTPGEICDIAHRSSSLPSWVMDTLIELVSRGQANAPNVGIYDTRLPAALMNHHSRFLNTALKDRVKLKFTDVPLEKAKKKLPERIYFQFNMDKQHWVGVCIDTKAYSLQVLDCNTSFHTDSLLKKELNPIANLIPYVLKSLGYLENNAGVKAFTVSRCKGIPQISSQTDAAVMTVLLIQAHICEGICGCKAITPHFLPDAAKQLAKHISTHPYILSLDPQLQIGILQVTLLWLAPPHMLHDRRRLKAFLSHIVAVEGVNLTLHRLLCIYSSSHRMSARNGQCLKFFSRASLPLKVDTVIHSIAIHNLVLFVYDDFHRISCRICEVL